MSTVTQCHPLLEPGPPSVAAELPEALLDELRDLARRHDHLPVRSRQLFEQLRKMLGQERLGACLQGIQCLAEEGEPAGARLLAAFLDANTPGSQLLPRIRRFRSTGRLLNTDPELMGASFWNDWQQRLQDLAAACQQRLGTETVPAARATARPVDQHPLPLLRQALTLVTADLAEADPGRADLDLVAGLVRLECDAYQERVSRLAGAIDPFRVTAVMRALPLLSRADAEVRDLGRLAVWLADGDVEAAFRRRVPRFHEVLDESERPQLTAALQDDPQLARLETAYRALLASPLSIRHLAGPVARMLILGRALHREGLRENPLGLLAAVSLVLTHCPAGRFQLALTPELREALSRILLAGQRGGLDDLAGLAVRGDDLILSEPELGLGDRIWRDDLPTLEQMQSPRADTTDAADDREAAEDPAQVDEDKSATAVKQLVMNNIGSVSILLGFLRNPKVTAIPGLVADVARRTRSGRVLEVIAGERALTSGHANKDVPRALLESPVNIPVKTLRRFIHVKYVSKTDLKRMAKDKARLRKEVCVEIEKYLESLN